MRVIEKLDEENLFLGIEGDLLRVVGNDPDFTLSIKDVRDLITELNELHTQMNINHHKELLDNKKK